MRVRALVCPLNWYACCCFLFFFFDVTSHTAAAAAVDRTSLSSHDAVVAIARRCAQVAETLALFARDVLVTAHIASATRDLVRLHGECVRVYLRTCVCVCICARVCACVFAHVCVCVRCCCSPFSTVPCALFCTCVPLRVARRTVATKGSGALHRSSASCVASAAHTRACTGAAPPPSTASSTYTAVEACIARCQCASACLCLCLCLCLYACACACACACVAPVLGSGLNLNCSPRDACAGVG